MSGMVRAAATGVASVADDVVRVAVTSGDDVARVVSTLGAADNLALNAARAEAPLIERLMAQVLNLSERNATLAAENGVLRATNTAVQGELTALRTAHAGVQGEVTALRETNHALQGKLRSVGTALQSARDSFRAADHVYRYADGSYKSLSNWATPFAAIRDAATSAFDSIGAMLR